MLKVPLIPLKSWLHTSRRDPNSPVIPRDSIILISLASVVYHVVTTCANILIVRVFHIMYVIPLFTSQYKFVKCQVVVHNGVGIAYLSRNWGRCEVLVSTELATEVA